MPGWWEILSKVLALLAMLVPEVERTFGGEPGQGEQKKNTALRMVEARMDYGPDWPGGEPVPTELRPALLAVANEAVDVVVAHANAAGVLTHGPRPEPGVESA